MPRPIKQTVAIFHGMLGSGNGGSEARAMWAAQALKHDFGVSLITVGPIDLTQLNHFYGTSIDSADISIRTLQLPAAIAGASAPSALRGAFSSRALKAVARDNDILISTYNPCDFGVPAIQCVADFSWDEDLRRRFDPAPAGLRGWFHRRPWLRRFYLRLCKTIGSSSGHRPFASQDLILANSRWTAAKLRERYGTASRVLYPPVIGACPDLSRPRHNDFVCIGRISAEKRIERMIRIIGAVRNRGHDVRLRIIGSFDTSRYARTVAALAARNPEWVLLEGQKVGAEKARILSDCLYGIHGREGEAFGIGVAEMVKAGCITFAPAEGGPAEILNHEALLYDDDDDAVEKITQLLASEVLRAELIRHLRRQAEQFSANRFMEGLRRVVDEFLTRRETPRRDSARLPSLLIRQSSQGSSL